MNKNESIQHEKVFYPTDLKKQAQSLCSTIQTSERSCAMIQLPQIGTYADVADWLKLSRKTVYKMVCLKEFKKGIYLGRGRFNIERLKTCIEKYGTYLDECKPGINL